MVDHVALCDHALGLAEAELRAPLFVLEPSRRRQARIKLLDSVAVSLALPTEQVGRLIRSTAMEEPVGFVEPVTRPLDGAGFVGLRGRVA